MATPTSFSPSASESAFRKLSSAGFNPTAASSGDTQKPAMPGRRVAHPYCCPSAKTAAKCALIACGTTAALLSPSCMGPSAHPLHVARRGDFMLLPGDTGTAKRKEAFVCLDPKVLSETGPLEHLTGVGKDESGATVSFKAAVVSSHPLPGCTSTHSTHLSDVAISTDRPVSRRESDDFTEAYHQRECKDYMLGCCASTVEALGRLLVFAGCLAKKNDRED